MASRIQLIRVVKETSAAVKFPTLIRTGLLILGGVVMPFAPGSQGQESNLSRIVWLSRVEGAVFISHAGSDTREQARVDEQLRQGDNLSTAENGLAEIELENGAKVSLENNSALQLNQLGLSNGSRVTQMTATQGVAKFDIKLPAGDVFGVATPTFQVAIPDGAECRIHAFSDGAWVQILQGRVMVSTKAGSTTLEKGQEIAVHRRDFLHRRVARLLYPDRFGQLLSQENAAINSVARPAPSGLSNQNWSNPANLTDLSGYRLWLDYPGLSFTWPGNPTVQGAQPGISGAWKLDPRLGWMWQTIPNPSGGLAPLTSGTWQLNPALGWILVPDSSPATGGNSNGN
jgi:FecR protein